MVLPDIKSQTREELAARFAEWKLPAYRLDQLLHWLYVRRVTDWDAMSNLPRELRDKLRQHYALESLGLVSKQGSRDTTQKFLWRLADGALIESVLIPASPALYGEASDRHTLCVSTQVGCAYGCKFCASGLEGWKRNLGPHEIVEQVLAIERDHEVRRPARTRSVWTAVAERSGDTALDSLADLTRSHDASKAVSPLRSATAVHTPALQPPDRLVNNLVIMGMGEPLANYDNLIKALTILNAPWGGGIGARKITISTSGLVPQIRKLADEPLQFRLAISLHGGTDEIRGKIMPVNKKYPLKELTAACEYYEKKKGRMITFEYILIAGVNDSLDQIEPLATLARKLHAKVNLIPYNKVEGLPWERPSERVQEQFLEALQARSVTATLRREKGHDIDAACGQLRLKTERALRGL